MSALGLGLGPLMFVVAFDSVRHGDKAAQPLVLEAGVERGGRLDVLVLVQGPGERVLEILPSLRPIQGDLRSLTLARAVAYEWIDGDLDNPVGAEAETALRLAAELTTVPGAALVLLPGTPSAAASRFVREREHALVLNSPVDRSGRVDLPSGR